MRKYRWYENVISGVLAVAVAIPVCVCAYRSQQIPRVPVATGTPIELEIPETVVPETDVIEPVEMVETLAVVEPIEPIEPEPVIEIEEIEPEYLGEFTVTAYCQCEKCCGIWASKRTDGIVYGASGEELTPGYSIAVDPKVIPYGTIVTINGTEYIAQDTGGAIRGNKIDLYMASHEEALEWGKQSHDVYLSVTK